MLDKVLKVRVDGIVRVWIVVGGGVDVLGWIEPDEEELPSDETAGAANALGGFHFVSC